MRRRLWLLLGMALRLQLRLWKHFELSLGLRVGLVFRLCFRAMLGLRCDFELRVRSRLVSK